MRLALGLGLPYGVGVPGGSPASKALIDETDGLALSFVDSFFLSSTGHYGSARVKDTSTPANNYNSHPFGLLTYAGASKKWVRGPSGLLIESDPALTLPYEWDENGDLLGIRVEDQRTNLFLNNREPETQDITVTAQAYTLSFYGTGSITLSGAHSDTLNGTGVNDRVTLTFTPEAGTLTCTVDGDIDFVQLEAGAFATSPIVTAGSTVTRAGDDISLATSAFPNMLPGSLLATGAFSHVASGSYGFCHLGGFQSANSVTIYRNGSVILFLVRDNTGTNQALLSSGTGSEPNVFYTMAGRFDTNDFAAKLSGRAIITDTSGNLPDSFDALRVGVLNGWVRNVMAVPRLWSDTEIEALAP